MSDPPATALPSSSFPIAATVKNQGTDNHGQTFSTQETLSVREQTLTGQYRVQACADGGNDVLESLEDDNCLTAAAIVKVVGPPDLVVTQVTVKNAPLSVARGGYLTISAAVKNQGEGDAPPSTLEFLFVHTVSGATKNLNGTKAYALIQPGLTSLQQQLVGVFGDTPPGTYVVQACADSLDVIEEASETNNCFTSTATITVQ